MADFVLDNLSVEPQKQLSSAQALLPPLLFLGAMMMGADFSAIELRPLHVLQIPHLKAMDYAHFIFPGSCALIWLATVRKWPNASSIITVLLCFELIGQIPAYAEKRITRLPVSRWLDAEETKSFESRSGFLIVQTGSKEGQFIIVAPEHAVQAREELRRIGIIRSGQPAAE